MERWKRNIEAPICLFVDSRSFCMFMTFLVSLLQISKKKASIEGSLQKKKLNNMLDERNCEAALFFLLIILYFK